MVKKRVKKKTAKKKVVRKRITRRNKKRVEALFKKAPKKRRVNTFLVTLIVGLLVIGFSFFNINPAITGFAIQSETSETKLILDEQVPISDQFKVLDINKDSNSMLNVDFKSDLTVSTFVETSDCSYWRAGGDRDNAVLVAIPDSKEINFNVGDLNVKTLQEIELYKANSLCLIFINRELGNEGNIDIKIKQTDKDKWVVIE